MSESQKILAAEKNGGQKNAPLETAPPAFTHREAHVAGAMGISRDTIRDLRKKHLREDTHWAMDRGKVMLCDEAVRLLHEALRLATQTPAPAVNASQRRAQATALPASRLIGPEGNPGMLLNIQRGPEVILKAWHATRNTAILEAYHPGTDPSQRHNIVRVRVKSNENFVRHMELPARLVQPPDLYELTRPCPRDRGRW